MSTSFPAASSLTVFIVTKLATFPPMAGASLTHRDNDVGVALVVLRRVEEGLGLGVGHARIAHASDDVSGRKDGLGFGDLKAPICFVLSLVFRALTAYGCRSNAFETM